MSNLLAELRAEATATATRPDGSYSVADRADAYLALLRGLEGAGESVVTQELERIMRRGATEHLRDSDRRTEPGKSRRGNPLPATLPAVDAKGRAMRLPLAKCRRADVQRAVNAERARARRSYQREDALRRLLDRMDAAGCDLVGDLDRRMAA